MQGKRFYMYKYHTEQTGKQTRACLLKWNKHERKRWFPHKADLIPFILHVMSAISHQYIQIIISFGECLVPRNAVVGGVTVSDRLFTCIPGILLSTLYPEKHEMIRNK